MWSATFKANQLDDMLIDQSPFRASSTFIIKRRRRFGRNSELLEWCLVAKRRIQKGEFIGFYDGDVRETCTRDSVYAVSMDRRHCIVPFPNEADITYSQRQKLPLTCMNEPNKDQYANCFMSVQDFSAEEIHNVHLIADYTHAHFFRALACFACCDIEKDEELTWWYQNSYQKIRDAKQYTAGKQCKAVTDNVIFILPNSQSVLNAVKKVSHQSVVAVFTTIRSARFDRKMRLNKKRRRARKRTSGSSSESSDDGWSSGSEQPDSYTPSVIDRQQRLRNRARPVEGSSKRSNSASSSNTASPGHPLLLL